MPKVSKKVMKYPHIPTNPRLTSTAISLQYSQVMAEQVFWMTNKYKSMETKANVGFSIWLKKPNRKRNKPINPCPYVNRKRLVKFFPE